QEGALLVCSPYSKALDRYEVDVGKQVVVAAGAIPEGACCYTSAGEHSSREERRHGQLGYKLRCNDVKIPTRRIDACPGNDIITRGVLVNAANGNGGDPTQA